MALFSQQRRPNLRPKDSYELEVPEDATMRRTGPNKFEIERKPQPDGRPIDTQGRPIDGN